MFRRPPPSQPPPPLGLEDLEAEPRSPLVTRRSVRRAVVLFVGGIAWGAAVHFADSLPVDAGFLAFALKVGGGFVFVLAVALVLLFRGFEVDRVALAVACVAAGATIGLSFGPAVAAPVTVTGASVFSPSVPAGLPETRGDVACEWAGGHWKIGSLLTGPLDGFATTTHLAVDFLRKTITLTDGATSTLIAIGNEALVPPADAPPRGAGDRSGTLDLDLLQVNLEATPADPNEVRARFTWDCPGPSGG